jgi:hypothetical protein
MPPLSTNRAWLVSFSMAFSVFIGLIFCTVAVIISLSFGWIAFGLLLTAIIALLGLMKTGFVSRLYQLWYRGVRFYLYQISRLLVRICFYLIFIAAGGMKSALGLKRPPASRSQWVARQTLKPTSYASQYVDNPQGAQEKGWISQFAAWASRSDNKWAFCVLPFLMLLRALDIDQESGFPTNIYTLY